MGHFLGIPASAFKPLFCRVDVVIDVVVAVVVVIVVDVVAVFVVDSQIDNGCHSKQSPLKNTVEKN